MLLFNSNLAYTVLQKVSITDKFEAKWNNNKSVCFINMDIVEYILYISTHKKHRYTASPMLIIENNINSKI